MKRTKCVIRFGFFNANNLRKCKWLTSDQACVQTTDRQSFAGVNLTLYFKLSQQWRCCVAHCIWTFFLVAYVYILLAQIPTLTFVWTCFTLYLYVFHLCLYKLRALCITHVSFSMSSETESTPLMLCLGLLPYLTTTSSEAKVFN